MRSTTRPSRLNAWSFGGYPYALMPLVLPHPSARGDSGDMRVVMEQLELLRAEVIAAGYERPDSVEQLFWFRWITGNQLVSALWQILDDELGLVLSDEVATAARNAATLLDAYSALLIYAGTLPREIYHGLIRPGMVRQHRSFSGRWAQDYVPVMIKLKALRSKYRKLSTPDFVYPVIDASKRNHRVHMAVAAKLVPGEDSLLRSNDDSALVSPTEDAIRLYDAFYITSRMPVPRESIVEQIIRRLRAITLELRTNGLYPAESSSLHECPAQQWGEELVVLEEKMVDLLQGAAESATSALRAGSSELSVGVHEPGRLAEMRRHWLRWEAARP